MTTVGLTNHKITHAQIGKKLNKRQQIAANLIGLGHRPSEVANKLSITKETISRWRAQENFEIEVDQVTNALL